MAKDSISKVGKPQLRGLLQSQIKKNLILAVAMCTAAAIAQKFLINDERKRVYADFYKTYDIEKSFNRMRNKGLFDSCAPDN